MTGKPQGLWGEDRSVWGGLETLRCSSAEGFESAESTGIGGNGATMPMSMEVTVKTQLKPMQEVWQAFNFRELLEAETNSSSQRDDEEMLTLRLWFVMVFYLLFWGSFSFNYLFPLGGCGQHSQVVQWKESACQCKRHRRHGFDP